MRLFNLTESICSSFYNMLTKPVHTGKHANSAQKLPSMVQLKLIQASQMNSITAGSVFMFHFLLDSSIRKRGVNFSIKKFVIKM